MLKKNVQKISYAGLVLTIFTFLSWYVFFEPKLLFSHSVKMGSVEVRSDRPIPDYEIKNVLKHVESRLRKFDFHDQVESPKIFLVFSENLKSIYSVKSLWQSHSIGLSPNVFIGLDEHTAKNPTFNSKLEYVITYESSLKMVQSKLGLRAYSSLPVWIKEGIGEWISAPTQYQLSKAMMMFRMAAPEMTKEKGGKRNKAHMLVAYLIEKEGRTLSEILNLDLSEETVLSEMF